MLHIISSTTGQDVLFERVAKGDVVLFVADAVLGLQKNSQLAIKLRLYAVQFECYALEPDMLARGIDLDDGLTLITVVDYPGFVSLTVKHAVIKTWR